MAPELVKLVGHKRQRDRLRELLKKDRLPGAMIFSGQSGIGKMLAARELARSLICSQQSEGESTYGGCGKCASCYSFDAGSHPDFHLVECLDRNSANAASTRSLLHVLSLRAFSSPHRVVIFNDAEHLSSQICNILLKSLEEPRPGLHFILVCANHSRLPPTLLSRCQIWHFDRLKETEILRILRARPSAEEIAPAAPASLSLDELALLADGSLENIDKLSENEQIWSSIKDGLERLFEGDAEPAFELFRELSKEKDKLRTRLHLLRIHARQRMIAAAQPAEKLLWCGLVSNMLSAEELIFERNLSVSYVLNASILNFLSSPLPPSFTTHIGSVNLISKSVI